MSRTAWAYAVIVSCLFAALCFKPQPILIWNASASAPIGLYLVERQASPKMGDLLAISPPEPLARFLAGRGYIGAGLPLLKRVSGLPGQVVCRIGGIIQVDGIVIGEALARDRQGRELPVWQGCRVIGGDELFLMNGDVRDSLDGRYFGPIPANAVIGRAIPLWTDAPDCLFQATTGIGQDKSARGISPQAIDMAFVLPCWPVGARAAFKEFGNPINGVSGTVHPERACRSGS